MMTVCPGLASCGIVTCTEKVGPVAVAIGALSTEPTRSSTRPSAAKRLPVTVTTLPAGPDEGLTEMKACGVHAQAIAATPRPAVAMPTTDSQITRARRVIAPSPRLDPPGSQPVVPAKDNAARPPKVGLWFARGATTTQAVQEVRHEPPGAVVRAGDRAAARRLRRGDRAVEAPRRRRQAPLRPVRRGRAARGRARRARAQPGRRRGWALPHGRRDPLLQRRVPQDGGQPGHARPDAGPAAHPDDDRPAVRQ